MAKTKMAEKPVSTRKVKNRDYTPSEVVVNDDFSFMSPTDGKRYAMTLKQKEFCETYLEFRGDGVAAILEVYPKVKDPRVAAVMAYENLRKPHLMAYVSAKLVEYGFNDDNVTKQHLYIMNQFGDLQAKNKAIDMYYKLKGTYAPDKSLNVNVNYTPGEKVRALTDEFEKKLKGETE